VIGACRVQYWWLVLVFHNNSSKARQKLCSPSYKSELTDIQICLFRPLAMFSTTKPASVRPLPIPAPSPSRKPARRGFSSTLMSSAGLVGKSSKCRWHPYTIASNCKFDSKPSDNIDAGMARLYVMSGGATALRVEFSTTGSV